MNRLIDHTRRWGQAALDLLLPPQCLTCDAPVDRQGGFCAPCFNRMHFISDPSCHRCGVALEQAGPPCCPRCLETPPIWDRARAAMRYDEHSRRLLLPFKHNDRPELARPLAVLMARAGAALLAEAELLVPVPLHPARLRSRGYNQAALLAAALGRGSGIAVALDALVRTRITQPLGELSAERRLATVDGAFGVRRGAGARLQGRRVLLVDDVLTSGATCTACTRALLQGGAAGVDVLVAARVPDPRAPRGRALAIAAVSTDVRSTRR